MTSSTVNGVAYTQVFDAENRLMSVAVGGQTTTFYYDADGNRILTIQPNGTKVYTPFPEFEKSVPTSGATTQRSSYTLAGQLIAVRVRTGTTGNGALYFAYADHLGNVSAWTNASGTFVSGSLARFEPFGGYRTTPDSSVNPGISDRGFTGHKQNNTGANDLGLIYMNARYYLPEIGRFISADTIVPEPKGSDVWIICYSCQRPKHIFPYFLACHPTRIYHQIRVLPGVGQPSLQRLIYVLLNDHIYDML
jgi:RHS repeat-associated protein